MTLRLSKGKYLVGLHCTKRLWLNVHQPEKASAFSSFQRHLMNQGIEVGRYARTLFPDGVLININIDNLEQSIADTQAAMDQGASTIFEAAFMADGVYAIVDLLHRDGDSWRLVEVKSSTRVKEDFLYDVAIQRHVLESSGLKLSGADVMVVNTGCEYPELDDFFRVQDVTESTNDILADLPAQLREFKQVVGLPQAPEVTIGNHCKSPVDCPFKAHCWAEVDGRPLVFDIPRLSADKKEELRDQEILFVDDLPDDYPLTPSQEEYVHRLSNGNLEVDADGISGALNQLEYPLYFFDFETFGSAIPRFEGMRPYEQLPFQFSCHRWDADGTVTHDDFLHLDEHDPRPHLVEAMLDCLGNAGTIVAYGAAFEKTVMKKLAGAFPHHAETIQSLVDRVWDQIVIFNDFYKDPGFGKSVSLKSVLPVVVPKLSYDALEVGNGADAQSVWIKMIHTPPGPDKDKMVENLREYCHLDTLAMVEIHRVLTQYQT